MMLTIVKCNQIFFIRYKHWTFPVGIHTTLSRRFYVNNVYVFMLFV